MSVSMMTRKLLRTKSNLYSNTSCNTVCFSETWMDPLDSSLVSQSSCWLRTDSTELPTIPKAGGSLIISCLHLLKCPRARCTPGVLNKCQFNHCGLTKERRGHGGHERASQTWTVQQTAGLHSGAPVTSQQEGSRFKPVHRHACEVKLLLVNG